MALSLLLQGKEIIQTIKVKGNEIEAKNIPVGTYFLQMPVTTEYSQEYIFNQMIETGNIEENLDKMVKAIILVCQGF